MKIDFELMLNKYGLSITMLGFSSIVVNLMNPYITSLAMVMSDLIIIFICLIIMKKYGMKRPNKTKRQSFETVITIIMFITTFLVIFNNKNPIFFTYGCYLVSMSCVYLFFIIAGDKFIKKPR